MIAEEPNYEGVNLIQPGLLQREELHPISLNIEAICQQKCVNLPKVSDFSFLGATYKKKSLPVLASATLIKNEIN